MGKIRIKTLGNEDAEKKQKEEARKRAETKRVEKKETGLKQEEVLETKTATNITPQNQDDNKIKTISKYKAKTTKNKRSKNYRQVSQQIDKTKTYQLNEALELLPKLKIAKFDESVELHINTTEKGISGNVTLPYGTGKKVRVAVADYSDDAKFVEELIKKIEQGKIDFDVLLATPDSMPKLAKVARFLGPKGLMPNPKNGTVTASPKEAAKKFEGGQINFKTEAKFPILHMNVGKVSFDTEKLAKNIIKAIEAVQVKNIKSVTLKSTMSPGMKINLNSLTV